MSVQTVIFDEVSFRTEKSGKCIICGKRRKRAKKFWQTLSPFNKNEDGTIKSRSTIFRGIQEQAQRWKKEPIDCCSY